MTKNSLLKTLIFATTIILGLDIQAQMKIGNNPTTINANSVLEIESTNKGLLLPRIGLTSTTSFAPLAAHIAGMTVYNTATAGDVTPGYYYNDGSKWVRIFGVSAANNTTAANLITITNGTGATLTAMTVGVDTTALKSFLNNKIQVTTAAPLTGNGTAASPLGVTQNNTTAASLITITNGTGASFTAMTVGVDTTALKTFLAGKVAIVANAPLSGAGTTASPLAITTGDLTAGSLLQTTGTPTAALLKTAGLQVDTTALKSFLAGKVSVVANAPLTGAGTTASPLGITQNTTTAGNLVAITNGTNATFTAMTVAVDTTALKSFIASRTTNTLTNPTNTITSTVNGIVVTAPAVNTVANSFVSSTRMLTTTVNGVAGTAVNIPLGPDSTLANNGLSMNGDTVQLGGILTKPTTITTSATNTIALAGLQDGAQTDCILTTDCTTGVVKKLPASSVKKLGVVTTAATSFTIPDTADVVIYNGTANTTFTLPAASASYGRELRILNFAQNDLNVQITLSTAIISEGASSNVTDTRINSKSTAYQYPAGLGSQVFNTITLISNGTAWYKLGN